VAEVTNDDANDLADEILSREEFLPAGDPGPLERGVERVIEIIGDVLGRIFGAFGGVGGGAGQLFAIILLVLAVIVLGFAIYRALAGRKPKEKGENVSEARIVFDEVVEPETLRAELSNAKQQGDWRGAVIAGFRLAVLSLIEDGIAREIAGATTGDFARAVQQRRPELLDAYAPASSSFERAFYSDLHIEQDDLQQVENLLARLQLTGAR